MRFEDLKFERIADFNEIPRYLLEQIPDRNYDIENIYTLGPIFTNNPLNWLFALKDQHGKVKGVLWATIDPVVQVICVNILSVDKRYQHPIGAAVRESIKFLRSQQEGTKLKKEILWATTRPRAFEKFGCRRFNRTIMVA